MTIGKYLNSYLLLILLIGIISCEEEPVIQEGMSPIYVSADDFNLIYSSDTMAFGELGNIVVVGDYIFINEKYKGIHVIDNSDPENPIKKYFWNIPGNLEFTIDGNILYADNSIHLLVLDISDFSDIKLLSYVEDWYIKSDDPDPRPPEGYVGPFECVDKSKGIHVGWVMSMIEDAKCYAY